MKILFSLSYIGYFRILLWLKYIAIKIVSFQIKIKYSPYKISFRTKESKEGSMVTFAECQREYDNRTPEESDCECPECGANIKQEGLGYKCTVCDWFVEPDFFEMEGGAYEC